MRRTSWLLVYYFGIITSLTGDDLFMKLVAAIVKLVSQPVSEKYFTAAHLHTHTHTHTHKHTHHQNKYSMKYIRKSTVTHHTAIHDYSLGEASRPSEACFLLETSEECELRRV